MRHTRTQIGASLYLALLSGLAVSTAVSYAGTTEAQPEVLFRIRHSPPDQVVSRNVQAILDRGEEKIVAFFERPFLDSVSVEICPDRSAFTATFPAEWGLTETQCWMVATGVADRLTILSPRVWREEACEHDPDDEQHVEGILHHELVHVYHGQNNSTKDFTGAEDLGWFIEGLAVYVSGQLEEGHIASAREALELNLAPESLADAWSGKYRYGVCGSLAKYLDVTCGRGRLREMLACTSQDELLDVAGLQEQELLERWREFVRSSE